MNKRFVLSRIIRAMLMLLGMAFLFVLFRSLGGPTVTPNSTATFDSVVVGQTALRRLGQQRVWVTRLSNLQIRQVKTLNPLVIDAQQGCQPSVSLCVIIAESSRSGIDLVYSRAAPAQLLKDSPWYGGFVDPSSGGVFDILGRAYKGARSNDQRASLEQLDLH